MLLFSVFICQKWQMWENDRKSVMYKNIEHFISTSGFLNVEFYNILKSAEVW